MSICYLFTIHCANGLNYSLYTDVWVLMQVIGSP